MSGDAKANIKIRNTRNKRSGGCILHFLRNNIKT